MAVYTTLERPQIEAFIAPFGIGTLEDFEGVAGGIENTNYFIACKPPTHADSQQQAPHRFVLTIFEQVAMQDLTFYIELTTMLNSKGLPVPCPLRDATGNALHSLAGKPALLVPRVSGEHPVKPTPEQCRQLGATLARVHLACLDWPVHHTSIRSLAWLKATAAQLAPHLDPGERPLLNELPRFEALATQHQDLPRAVIHGDLFRDNTLFDGDSLEGLIDFNSAGDGYLLLDLAIVVNDWCSQADGSLDPERTRAILDAYHRIRPFTAGEHQMWNDFLRLAALRFWTSRRHAGCTPESPLPTGSLVQPKDPLPFKQILQHRVDRPQKLDPHYQQPQETQR